MKIEKFTFEGLKHVEDQTLDLTNEVKESISSSNLLKILGVFLKNSHLSKDEIDTVTKKASISMLLQLLSVEESKDLLSSLKLETTDNTLKITKLFKIDDIDITGEIPPQIFINGEHFETQVWEEILPYLPQFISVNFNGSMIRIPKCDL